MSHPDTLRRAARRAERKQMSEPIDQDARIQPWFATMLASMVPALVSFALPEIVRVALFAASGLLFAAGCVMLYRHETQSS
jgi:hypothetical protein